MAASLATFSAKATKSEATGGSAGNEAGSKERPEKAAAREKANLACRISSNAAYCALRNKAAGEVADFVELHVQAKRYLCHAKDGYHARLSSASRGTLKFQGGAMAPAEATRFESHPLFRDILRMRVWDERAKVPNGSVLPQEKLEEWTRQYWEEQQ